jgi:gliding motility-associated-like protein
LFVENGFGCISPESEPVEVVVSDFLPPPTVTVSGSLDFCEGGSVILSGPDGFEQYNWSDGSTGQSISVIEGVDIALVVTNSEGVQSLPSDEITVVVYELPEIQVLDKVQPSCAGFDDGSITIGASGGLEPYQYSWEGHPESASTLSSISTGVYTSTVIDENGCSETLNIELEEPDPITVEEVVEPAYCPDFSDGSIELIVSGGTPPYAISWSAGDAADYFNNLSPGDYSYEVKDGNNCELGGTIRLGYENEVCFVVPGIITPNDDGFNDAWRIDGLEAYPDVTVEIFDRWGKRIFYSEGYDTEFDGTYDGRELPMESYHYMIDLHNGSERIIGNITIVR